MDKKIKIDNLKKNFRSSTQVLNAIGDETRQLIIVALMDTGCQGSRVGEITKKTHLSRPTVSHHIKILKDAGIISVRKEKTMNFYYLKTTSKLMNLKKLINSIEELIDYNV